ncbi:MAG: VacJ family lipoprotein [Rhodospirillaceae bacterium]
MFALTVSLLWCGPAGAADQSAPASGGQTSFYDAAIAQTAQSGEDFNDPLESLNRAIFLFNDGFQENLLRPVVDTYNNVVPTNGRKAIKGIFENLSEPITLANDLLQFEFHRAMNTLVRAFVNTVFGFGGAMNLAQDMGLESHKEDFGQTLAVWGMGEGGYLMLPFLGPSNPRDAIGRFLIDAYFDPLGIYLDNIDMDEVDLAIDAVDGVLDFADVIDDLEQIRKTSVDYYAAIRSLYRQKRKAEIANGQSLDLPPIPDISPEFRGELPAPRRRQEPVAGLILYGGR